MQHFNYLTESQLDDMFVVKPQKVTPESKQKHIALALGATLYTPATHKDLSQASLRAATIGCTSMVWCLEDAIPHQSVPEAEKNVVATLQLIHQNQQLNKYPLLFVRVRDAEQIYRIAEKAGDAISVLTGFSLPKITPTNVRVMLTAVSKISKNLNRPMYAMPILETPDLVHIEKRRDSLTNLYSCFNKFKENILCVRVGGTDLSGLYGIRRDRDTPIWNVAVVRDVFADIINQFGREGEYIISGAVWEHIPGPRLFKPKLRMDPFVRHHETDLRKQLIENDVDALMREISLDKNNGMHGKTVIHPTHVSIVNSMLTVSAEEHEDATAINESSHIGGVISSAHGRMNEMGPHQLWAKTIHDRASVYGVLKHQDSLVDLLALGQQKAAEEYHSNLKVIR